MAPTELRLPNAPLTPQDRAIFLVLRCEENGEGFDWHLYVSTFKFYHVHRYIYIIVHSLPPFPTGPTAPIFPITLLCRDKDEFFKLRPLSPYLHRITTMNLGDHCAIADAVSFLQHRPRLERILQTKSKFYPVFKGNGNRELIAMTWYVPQLPSLSLYITQ